MATKKKQTDEEKFDFDCSALQRPDRLSIALFLLSINGQLKDLNEDQQESIDCVHGWLNSLSGGVMGRFYS
jgi:hypothetical protein